MSEDYVREKLLEATANLEKSIADLRLQLSRQENPDLRRELEYKEREFRKLRAEIEGRTKLQSHNQVTTRETSLHQDGPSSPGQSNRATGSSQSEMMQNKIVSQDRPPRLFPVVITWMLLFIVLVGTLTISAYCLRDLWMTLTVFLVSLIALVVILPFIGLNTQMIKEETWFRTYLAALEKIPGLDVLINALVDRTRSEVQTKTSKSGHKSNQES